MSATTEKVTARTAQVPPSPRPAPTAIGKRPARARRFASGKQLKWIVAAIVLVLAAYVGLRYWRAAQLYESTDDAYVGANQVEVTAQVAGNVIQVYVHDQQHVKAGDPLFDIDPKDYQLAVERARAQLDLARQNVSEQSAALTSAEAVLAQRQAEARNAQSIWQRNRELVRSGFLSAQAAETSRTQLTTSQAAVTAAQADVARARSALGQTGDENAAVQAASAALRQAEVNLQRTRVTASTDGVVANFTLQPGTMVQPGVPLFVVISDTEYWVDANFKETQLKSIRPGEKAEVRSDMYPDRVFHGVVQSLAGGSGTAFSLLPPQNATGNWVKVTQRVPVRVRIEDPDPKHPLRIGTSATVQVFKAP